MRYLESGCAFKTNQWSLAVPLLLTRRQNEYSEIYESVRISIEYFIIFFVIKDASREFSQKHA